jgi:hypothetical protein
MAEATSGDGLLRFSSMEEAAAAVRRVDADYARQRVAARELAAAHFDADRVAEEILDVALAPRPVQSVSRS